MVLTTLNRVCELAMCRSMVAGSAAAPGVITSTNRQNSLSMRNTYITPMILNIACDKAARLADTLAPIHARAAVMVVPIFSPRMKGTAISKLIRPDPAIPMVKPIVALEDCSSMVMTAPAITASIGLERNIRNISLTAPLSLRGVRALFMILSPRNRRPNPSSTFPATRHLRSLENNDMKNPSPAAGRA